MRPFIRTNKFLGVLICNVHHALCVGIAEIALVREAQVDFGLIEGVLDSVRVHAGRETRYQFLYAGFIGGVDDIVVYE